MNVSDLLKEISSKYPTATLKTELAEEPVDSFQVVMENGWTLSVSYGPTHYLDTSGEKIEYPAESRSAELIISKPNGDWYHAFSVKGGKTSKRIFTVLSYLSKLEGQ